MTLHYETLPKKQRTQGLSALIKVLQSISYHKLINMQLQDLDQTSASKFQPNSASKSRLNFSLIVLTKLQPSLQLELTNIAKV